MRALLASSAAPSRILHSALFVAGLLGVAALLRSVDTIPFWSWTRDEIVHVATGDADCDTLLLGSSRIHYGIQPQAFDARMAELGMPTKSWNLAFCGMRSHDSAALLDWILEHKPKGLKRVLVELHSFDQKVRGGDWMTDMQVEMHTPGQLLPRVRSILLSNHSLPEKLQQFGYVALHTLSNALRAGQGLRLLDDQLADAPAARLDRRSLARRGWRPNGEDTAHSPQADAEHAEFLQNGEKYARIAREKTDDPCRPFLRGGFNLEAFAHQVESARRAGVEILFVVMPPFGYSFRGRDGVDAAARLATVIELDRFADHPELTDLSLYHDQSHLNSQGALAVSRLLAEETARALAEATAPAPASAPTLTAQWQTTPSLRLRTRPPPRRRCGAGVGGPPPHDRAARRGRVGHRAAAGRHAAAAAPRRRFGRGDHWVERSPAAGGSLRAGLRGCGWRDRRGHARGGDRTAASNRDPRGAQVAALPWRHASSTPRCSWPGSCSRRGS